MPRTPLVTVKCATARAKRVVLGCVCPVAQQRAMTRSPHVWRRLHSAKQGVWSQALFSIMFTSTLLINLAIENSFGRGVCVYVAKRIHVNRLAKKAYGHRIRSAPPPNEFSSDAAMGCLVFKRSQANNARR